MDSIDDQKVLQGFGAELCTEALGLDQPNKSVIFNTYG